MNKPAYLVLADGSIYEGYRFGAEADVSGEVVFCTSMAGYQEMLTDPSYAGQILVPTYPLMGNYGTNEADVESAAIRVRGFVVREECTQPSHYLNKQTLHDYLAESGVPGIHGVDTRAITRRLRSGGVLMGMITGRAPQTALTELRQVPDYGSVDYVRQVSTAEPYQWLPEGPAPAYHVAVFDCGLKYNILRILNRLGCRVTVVPCTTPAADILAMDPDGIMLSPGPGDPDLPKVDYIVATVRELVGKKPVMGICFGNQLVNRAFGGRHFKLKFGHRGGNHPVRELATGRVHITAQNHGYAVDPDNLGEGLEITHLNLNDGTVEGLKHRELPVFSIQYHSEASPGPLDSVYIFDEFIEMMKSAGGKTNN
jgi:carbamoyl-phosphate synthase small subunit